MTNTAGRRRSAVLRPLPGSPLKEWLLLSLYSRGELYARELAPVQQIPARLEYGGVVDSRRRGRTRPYRVMIVDIRPVPVVVPGRKRRMSGRKGGDDAG